MSIVICVAILNLEDRASLPPGAPFALWKESFWLHEIPQVGDSIWFKALAPLTRFVKIREVDVLPADKLRPFEKYEIEFLVTKREFEALSKCGWKPL